MIVVLNRNSAETVSNVLARRKTSPSDELPAMYYQMECAITHGITEHTYLDETG